MRDLTLLDTAYLAGLLALSLVLPLMLSLRGPKQTATRKSSLRLVCFGQALLVIAAVVVLASSTAAPFAALCSVLSCVFCAAALHQQLCAASGVYQSGRGNL